MGEVIQVVLASVLRKTTKKSRQLFGEEKCTAIQNPGYAYARVTTLRASKTRKGRKECADLQLQQ